MKYSALLLVLCIYACGAELETPITNNPIIPAENFDNAIFQETENSITYEGKKYRPNAVDTHLVSAEDSLYTTKIELASEEKITIILNYTLREGIIDCGTWDENPNTLNAEIIFSENIAGIKRSFSSAAPSLDTASAAAPGGTLELFDYNGKTWSIAFGGSGDDITATTEKLSFGKCGTGTIIGLYLNN